MRRAEQRHSPRRIAKRPELSGLFPQFGPQFGTISMKDDGGRKAVFAHVNPMTGGKTPRSAPVTFQKLHDVCRKAVFAHVNPMR